MLTLVCSCKMSTKTTSFETRFIDAETNTILEEHLGDDGVTYIDIEAGKQYFIKLLTGKQQNLPPHHCVVADVTVDGSYIEYERPLQLDKAIMCGIHEVDKGKSATRALQFQVIQDKKDQYKPSPLKRSAARSVRQNTPNKSQGNNTSFKESTSSSTTEIPDDIILAETVEGFPDMDDLSKLRLGYWYDKDSKDKVTINERLQIYCGFKTDREGLKQSSYNDSATEVEQNPTKSNIQTTLESTQQPMGIIEVDFWAAKKIISTYKISNSDKSWIGRDCHFPDIKLTAGNIVMGREQCDVNHVFVNKRKICSTRFNYRISHNCLSSDVNSSDVSKGSNTQLCLPTEVIEIRSDDDTSTPSSLATVNKTVAKSFKNNKRKYPSITEELVADSLVGHSNCTGSIKQCVGKYNKKGDLPPHQNIDMLADDNVPKKSSPGKEEK